MLPQLAGLVANTQRTRAFETQTADLGPALVVPVGSVGVGSMGVVPVVLPE